MRLASTVLLAAIAASTPTARLPQPSPPLGERGKEATAIAPSPQPGERGKDPSQTLPIRTLRVSGEGRASAAPDLLPPP